LAALLLVRESQYVAGLAFQHATHLFKGVEIHTESFAFLQAPQSCVANAGLFS
jgi:hypothetical protein